MKFNEKNLCAYAVSSTVTADKEGYLMKKGEVHKAFHKRWFVLKGNLLFYFEKQGEKEPLGLIILEGCTIELEEIDAQYSFKIVFHGFGNRTYVLCADSQESMELWMKNLACASYDYMKSMVTELQRQLKETRCKDERNAITDSTHKNSLCYVNDVPESPSISSACNEALTSSPHPPPRIRPRPQPMSPRNKVLFNTLHTAYGRPVLRDRNLWNYDKKSKYVENENTCNAPKQRAVPEQNLLISL